MKFAAKLTLCITLLITLLLSVGGIAIVQRNFNSSMSTALAQHIEQITLEQYGLESNMLNYLNTGEVYSDGKVAEFAARFSGYSNLSTRLIGLYNASQNQISSNLPEVFTPGDIYELLNGSGNIYLIRKAGETYFMGLSASIAFQNHQVYLIGAYDVSRVFAERDQQLMAHLVINGALVLVSAIAVGLLSVLLTKPITKLNQISKRISSGHYSERTGITSRDEIGQLSVSFDQMADAVEKTIGVLENEVVNKDLFITAFTHEVKTPTTAILGYADLLRRAPCDTDTQLEYAEVIYREGQRLETMSKKLMTLFSLREEQIVFSKISVSAYLNKLEKLLRNSLNGVLLQVEAQAADVLAEPDLLDCLLTNLVVNAEKSRPADRVVYLKGRRKNDRYEFSVEDHGCGISKQDLPHIQELFYMADRSRTYGTGGAGIGLFLCGRIAEVFGTSLTISSELNVGTTISFSLEVCDE